MPQNNPDPQNPNQNQNPDPNPNPNPSPDLETPIPQNPAPVIDTVPRSEYNQTLENVHSLYRQTLQEAENRRLATERELENLRSSQHSPAPIPDDQLSPTQLIERAVAAQVTPLRTQFDSFMLAQQGNAYQSIKDRFRNLPQFAPFFTQLEPYIDTEMQGKTITVEAVQNAIAVVIGRFQMQAAMNPQPINPQQQNMNNNPQQQQFQQQQQNPQQQQQQNLRPPHLQPSAPPLPNRNGNQNLTPGGNPRVQLTELQARVARENKMTHDQYIDMMYETPENVIHSTVGIPSRTT